MIHFDDGVRAKPHPDGEVGMDDAVEDRVREGGSLCGPWDVGATLQEHLRHLQGVEGEREEDSPWGY